MSGGEKKGKAGRKPTGVKRVRFQVSCQAEELAALRQGARDANKTLSRYVLDAALWSSLIDATMSSVRR